MTSSQRWTLLLASVASLMVALDTLVVSTALSTIRLDLHASVAELEWTVNAYNLSFAVLLLTGGEDLFLERDIAGGSGDADGATRQAWWPADKVSAPRLAPYLYALESTGARLATS